MMSDQKVPAKIIHAQRVHSPMVRSSASGVRSRCGICSAWSAEERWNFFTIVREKSGRPGVMSAWGISSLWMSLSFWRFWRSSGGHMSSQVPIACSI